MAKWFNVLKQMWVWMWEAVCAMIIIQVHDYHSGDKEQVQKK